MAESPSIIRTSRIGRALIVPYLVTSLITLVIVGTIIYYTYDAQNQRITALQKEVGLRATSDINGYFGNLLEVLDLGRKSLSCAPTCAASGNTAANTKILTAMLAANPSISEVTLVGADGTHPLTRSRYQLLSNETKDLETIGTTEKFTKSLTTRTYYLSPPYLSEYSLPFITLGMPLISESGTTVGTILAEVDLSPMWGTVSSIKLERTGYVYVVDTTGRLLAYKDIAAVQKNQALSDIRGVEDYITNVRSSASYTSFTGETVTGIWFSVEATGWGVIVELPRKEIEQDLYILGLLSISSIILIGVFVLLFTRTVFRRLLMPVQKLHEGVQSLEKGDLTRRLNISSDDELGELATVFNQMAARVQESYRVLEQKVEERTRDLQKFQLAVANTAEHVVITDPDGVIIYANAAAEVTTGYSNAEMLGKKPSLWGRQMPKEFYDALWRTISVEKKTFIGEITNRRKNGEIYTAAAIISPILNAAGDVTFFVALESDISKKKALEQALVHEKEIVEGQVVARTRELMEERARLMASINSLSFGFVIAGVDDRILVKNAALSSILELTEEPGTTTQIIDSFKGVASGLDVLSHSCRECVELKRVVELKEVSHGKKYLRVFCTPVIVMNASGSDEVIGYVILVEDITETKIMERSREEFFAVASHELRTPLTAIRGNADMILSMYADKIVDTDMKEMLQDINSSSVRLIAVVNEFLDASRLEQGKVELKKEKFVITDVVDKVIRDMKAMIEQKGLMLTYEPPVEPVPAVFADKNRTEQILLNLVGNAIKFTKQGGITISLSRTGGFIVIRVVDTGDGVSEHNQTLLFRKFQQAGEDMLARDVTQSTGLGLYISRLIISGMGGTIGLEKSELGKGSTFFFTVPISE